MAVLFHVAEIFFTPRSARCKSAFNFVFHHELDATVHRTTAHHPVDDFSSVSIDRRMNESDESEISKPVGRMKR